MHAVFFILAFAFGVLGYLAEYKTNFLWRIYSNIFNVEREDPKSGFIVGAPLLTRIITTIVLMTVSSFGVYNLLTSLNPNLSFELLEVIFVTSFGFFAGISLLEFLGLWRRAKTKGFSNVLKEFISGTKKFASETVDDIKAVAADLSDDDTLQLPENSDKKEDRNIEELDYEEVDEEVDEATPVQSDELVEDDATEELEETPEEEVEELQLKELDVVEEAPPEKKKSMLELLDDMDKNLD